MSFIGAAYINMGEKLLRAVEIKVDNSTTKGHSIMGDKSWKLEIWRIVHNLRPLNLLSLFL